jgi:hypothetical protein
MENKQIECEITGDIAQNSDGTITFWIKSTDKWLPPEVAASISKRSPNQNIFWRHRSPTKPKFGNYPVIGVVQESEVKNGEIYNKLNVGGLFHPAQEDAKNWVIRAKKEKLQIGVSIGVNYFQEKDSKTIVGGYPLEYSLTPYPECKTCLLESEGEVLMADPTAADLQKRLDDLAEREKTVAEKEQKIETFKVEAEKKTIELEAKAKSVASEKESVAKELETVKGALVKLDYAYKEKIAELEKKPLIEKLKELENEFSYKTYASFIEKDMTSEQLATRIACLEKQKKMAPPPIVVSRTEKKEDIKGPTLEDIMKSAEDLPEDTKESIRKMYAGEKESDKIVKDFVALIKKGDK